MKANVNGINVDFELLLKVFKAKKHSIYAVEPIKNLDYVDSIETAAILFNILSYYVQLLKENKQNEFIEKTMKELIKLSKDGFGNIYQINDPKK